MSRAVRTVVSGLVAIVAILGVTLLIGIPSASASARVWLTTTAGTAIPENSQISPGTSVIVKVSGFGANATVLVQLGTSSAANQIQTDGVGTGTLTTKIPNAVSDAYLITATSDEAAATFVVVVGTTAAAAVVPPSSGDSSTSRPTTSLARTGAASPPITVSAVLLLALGTLLVRVSAPRLFGRHEREFRPRHSLDAF